MSQIHSSNCFDAVRIFAAACVLYCHQYALSGLPEPLILGVHSLAGFGVLIFFSISGYLVTASWLADPSFCRFAVRRALRIWPGFAAAILFSACVLGPLLYNGSVKEYFSHPAFLEYFKNLKFDLRDELPLKFNGNVLPSAINGSLWTIPLELWCYFGLAIAGIFKLVSHRWLVLVATSIVLYAYAISNRRGESFTTHWSVESRFLLEFSLFFAAGSLLKLFSFEGLDKRGLILLMACAVLAILAYALNRPILALWFVVPVIAIMIGNSSIPVARSIGRWGDVSYGLYLYAFPVQQSMIFLFANKISWSALLVATAAVTMTLAMLSWHLVERPAKNIGRTLLSS